MGIGKWKFLILQISSFSGSGLCSVHSLSQILIFSLEPQLSAFTEHRESLTQIHTFFFPLKCSKTPWMWHLSDEHGGGAGLTVGLGDLQGLFQL